MTQTPADWLHAVTAAQRALAAQTAPPIAVFLTDALYGALRQLTTYPAVGQPDTFMGLAVYRPAGLTRSVVLY